MILISEELTANSVWRISEMGGRWFADDSRNEEKSASGDITSKSASMGVERRHFATVADMEKV
jgi:hypothetical protein